MLIFFEKLILIIFLIFFYYKWIKTLIFRSSPRIAKWLGLTKQHPIASAAGVVQLTLIALSHVVYCVFLFYFLGIHSITFGFENSVLLPFGILVGIGAMGLSTMLCQGGMMIGEKIFPQNVPDNAKSWLTIARGGWMRHHLHNIEILPLPLAFTIVIIQISAEEMVFRGIILNYFLNNGAVVAVLVSTILFAYMQVFHMSSRASAMFPVLGALVLGLVNSILYINIPILLPLIVAHLAFFIFAMF